MDYNHSRSNKLCFVCGYLFRDFYPWSVDGNHPEYGEFCPSCGCEFGYEDATVEGLKNHRRHWLAAGSLWWDVDGNLPEKKPENWDPSEQLKNIPQEYL